MVYIYEWFGSYRFAVVCAFGILMVLGLVFREGILGNRFFKLFRVLFPSWRFFAEAGDVVELYYRGSLDGVVFGDWKQIVRKHSFRPTSLFLNAQGNLNLALYSTLEHLMQDIQDLPEHQHQDVLRLPTYGLVGRWVEYEVSCFGYKKFQFKLMVSAADVLISSVLNTAEWVKP